MIRAALAVSLAAVLGPLAAHAQHPLNSYADAVIQRYRRTDPHVAYTVTVRDADRSAYLVEITVANAPDPARLVIPEWAPGAYRFMRAGDNIADVIATTLAGDTLAVWRESANVWRVDTRGAARVVVRYSTAVRDAEEWATANNRWFLRATSGVIDGPRTFMYLDGAILAPSHVTFRLPAGWRIATGLVPTTDSTVYWAPGYDVLIDSPVLVGRFQDYRFTAGGVPHRAAVDLGGARPTYDEGAFVDVLRRVSEAGIALFGSAPYKDYTYIFAGAGGGLEHLNSTTIGFNASGVARNPAYHEGVTAHEFFHAWNVKRIRPAELGPFDYTQPVRTTNLWVAEGVTNYYTHLILLRSGLDSLDDFVRKIGNSITSHRNNPARLTVSPEQSSLTVWDDPTTKGSLLISYYLQGELVGFLLDLTIRDSTENRASLDDVMRYLFDHHAGERGYSTDDLLAAVRAVARLDLREFWRRYVSGTQEIPWNDFVEAAGWRVTLAESREPDRRLPVVPPEIEGGRPRAVALPGSAAERGGLRSGDELVRVNGRPVRRPGDVGPALEAVGAGWPVTLDVLRDGRPVTVTFRAEPYTAVRARLADAPRLTDRMRRIRAGIVTGSGGAR